MSAEGEAPRPLVVGVPTEVKDDERRVAIPPDGVAELRAAGVPVLVESGAGRGSSLAVTGPAPSRPPRGPGG